MEPQPLAVDAEAQPNPVLEATFVKISKHIAQREIPNQVRAVEAKKGSVAIQDQIDRRLGSFNIILDEVNRQVTETDEGAFVWKSEENNGVEFLATHLNIMPELTGKVADEAKIPDEEKLKNPPVAERLKHQVYIVFPALGLLPDGSGLSSMDLQIARAFNELPKVADGQSLDVFGVGDPAALGGKVTQEFYEKVKAKGFEAYGEIYSEFVQQQLEKLSERYGYETVDDFLEETRVVLQGVSRGTVMADQTSQKLTGRMPEIVTKEEVLRFRVFKQMANGAKMTDIIDVDKPQPDEPHIGLQRLFVNPSGTHSRNIISQGLRSLNMGIGMLGEIGVRKYLGGLRQSEYDQQPEFYAAMKERLGILSDTEEQASLKNALLWRGEMGAVAKGGHLDTWQKSFSVISSPDVVNIDAGNLAREGLLKVTDKISETGGKVIDFFTGEAKPHPRRGLVARQHGGLLTFGMGYVGHNYLNLLKGFESGSFNQKMAFVERHSTQKLAAP